MDDEILDEILDLPDMTEEDFRTPSASTSNNNQMLITPKVTSESIESASSNTKVVYNPRDPASAQASSFIAAFSNLKNSDLYKKATEITPQPSTSKALQGPLNPIGVPVASETRRANWSGPLLVSPRQRGNPLLKSIKNVAWLFQESLVPDYVMGETTCALFLSLRYHNLNPDYIQDRLKLLGSSYKLRVLIVQVDLADPNHAITHLNRLALLGNLTLMLAGSADEAGRIVETYKMFENKPPEMIMEREEDGEHVKLQSALTTVRAVNKTDAAALVKSFGTLEYILQASPSNLELCPGFGSHKAQQLHKVLHQPFIKNPRM